MVSFAEGALLLTEELEHLDRFHAQSIGTPRENVTGSNIQTPPAGSLVATTEATADPVTGSSSLSTDAGDTRMRLHVKDHWRKMEGRPLLNRARAESE